jgi:hypothetical protein
VSRNPRQNILQNLLRVFGAGVVGGDHHLICQIVGNAAHLGAFGAIAITTAAKDTDQPTRDKGPGRLEGILQTVGGMSIVHNHADVLLGAHLHLFHAAGHPAKGRQGLGYGSSGDAQMKRLPDRRQQIFNVELPHQG